MEKINNINRYIKIAWALIYLICLCYPFSTAVADSAHYYSLLAFYVGLGFVFYFILWPVSLLVKLRPHHAKGNTKNIIILFVISFMCIAVSLLILYSFWGLIFGDERSSPADKIEACIPFCFIAVDLIRLRFFGKKKKGFSYLLANLVLAFVIYLIALPVSSLFSFNGLEYEQNHGLVSAVIFLIANTFLANFPGLSDNRSDDSCPESGIDS